MHYVLGLDKDVKHYIQILWPYSLLAIFDWNCRLSRKRYEIGQYGTLIGNHRWRIDPCRLRWPWVTFDPDFNGWHYSTLNISETTRDRAIVSSYYRTSIGSHTCFVEWRIPNPGFKVTTFFEVEYLKTVLLGTK